MDSQLGRSLMGILQLEEDKTVFYRMFHNGVKTCIAFKGISANVRHVCSAYLHVETVNFT